MGMSWKNCNQFKSKEWSLHLMLGSVEVENSCCPWARVPVACHLLATSATPFKKLEFSARVANRGFWF